MQSGSKKGPPLWGPVAQYGLAFGPVTLNRLNRSKFKVYKLVEIRHHLQELTELLKSVLPANYQSYETSHELIESFPVSICFVQILLCFIDPSVHSIRGLSGQKQRLAFGHRDSRHSCRLFASPCKSTLLCFESFEAFQISELSEPVKTITSHRRYCTICNVEVFAAKVDDLLQWCAICNGYKPSWT